VPLPVATAAKPGLGVAMAEKFDIFRKLPDGNPLWVKAVDGLDQARDQLASLAESSPDEYFIYSAQNGSVIQARSGLPGTRRGAVARRLSSCQSSDRESELRSSCLNGV
jgi:hypothetical protein